MTTPDTATDTATDAGAAGTTVPRRPLRRIPLPWLAAALAALLCGYAGWSYTGAVNDESLAYSAARDRALSDGRTHLARLSSFDATAPDTSRQRWLASATGELREELGRQKTGPATATATATVTDAALTALDTRAGTAQLIATVTLTLAPAKGTPGTDRKRLEATLARTDGGWKVQALTAVPVGGR
ncbi:hypothetical protein ACFVIM_15105 [Streptomyces sp. NPDC057638]|uniref:hypothetical protein n=1 Tax=Streptomyces sp. NPDC057638 TaxID=3346190 RepID=UPI00368D8A2F